MKKKKKNLLVIWNGFDGSSLNRRSKRHESRSWTRNKVNISVQQHIALCSKRLQARKINEKIGKKEIKWSLFVDPTTGTKKSQINLTMK